MPQIELTNLPLYFAASPCTASNPSVAPLSVHVENLPVNLDCFLSHSHVSHQSQSLVKSTTFRCVGSRPFPKPLPSWAPPSLSQTVSITILLYFLHPVSLLSNAATSPNLKCKYHTALLRMQNAKYSNCLEGKN